MIFGMLLRGFERMNKVMMPLFFVLFVIMLVRVATLPGAFEGYKYLFVPDWRRLRILRPGCSRSDRRSSVCRLQVAARLYTEADPKKDVDVVTSANVAIFETLAALVLRHGRFPPCSPSA